jgi:hypothetical protein
MVKPKKTSEPTKKEKSIVVEDTIIYKEIRKSN